MKRPMSHSFAALLLSAAAALPAQAAEFRLPAEDYGKVVFSSRQSLGDAATIVQDRKNVFEPMNLRREDDPLRVLTRAVGRLDLLIEEDGERFASSCTATVVNDGTAILTNNHCIPGFSGRVLEASILLDYFDADSPTIRLDVATAPLSTDRDLDFSIVPILGAAPDDIVSIPLSLAEIQPLESLMIVHHPSGLPKKVTRFGCQAAESLAPDTYLRHRCDTLPGSSGAPILNDQREIVGVHHSGGLTSDDPRSFNRGTRLSSVMEATQALKLPATAAPPASTAAAPPPPPATTTVEAPLPSDPAASVNTLLETDTAGSTDAAGQINTIIGTDQ